MFWSEWNLRVFSIVSFYYQLVFTIFVALLPTSKRKLILAAVKFDFCARISKQVLDLAFCFLIFLRILRFEYGTVLVFNRDLRFWLSFATGEIWPIQFWLIKQSYHHHHHLLNIFELKNTNQYKNGILNTNYKQSFHLSGRPGKSQPG